MHWSTVIAYKHTTHPKHRHKLFQADPCEHGSIGARSRRHLACELLLTGASNYHARQIPTLAQVVGHRGEPFSAPRFGLESRAWDNAGERAADIAVQAVEAQRLKPLPYPSFGVGGDRKAQLCARGSLDAGPAQKGQLLLDAVNARTSENGVGRR